MVDYNWEPPEGYPARVHNNPLISNYVLALNPQWNTILNPQANLARQGVSIVNWVKLQGKSVITQAEEYFKTNPLPYSNPVDSTIDYSMEVQRAQQIARSYQVPFVYPENPIIKAARIRLENIERVKLIEENNARLADIEFQRLEKINDEEENRLAKQLAEKVKQDEIKRQETEIIPTVVSISSLIPLGIIAFLLINSRKDKK